MTKKSTRYKDKKGKIIYEGNIVGIWLSSPWDAEVPIFLEFKIIKQYGRWFCDGVITNSENDFLSNCHKHCEIIS